jgi:hypothetical protein
MSLTGAADHQIIDIRLRASPTPTATPAWRHRAGRPRWSTLGGATVGRCGIAPPLDNDALAVCVLPAAATGTLLELPFMAGGPPNEEGQGSDRLVFVMRR